MRIEPVKALGRSNMKRKRRFQDDRKPAREEHPFEVQLVPVENRAEEAHDQFIARYRPNATFLAHLIATRDGDPQTRFKRQTDPEIGTSRYRETAASPRKRQAGHLFAIDY